MTGGVYSKLNRVQKGNWTRLARAFSIAHANKVWTARLAEKERAEECTR